LENATPWTELDRAADLVKNVSWSVFVCVGLAVGTAVTQSRVPVMGFLGLISAPLAFGI